MKRDSLLFCAIPSEKRRLGVFFPKMENIYANGENFGERKFVGKNVGNYSDVRIFGRKFMTCFLPYGIMTLANQRDAMRDM